jgi:hypothetical protein
MQDSPTPNMTGGMIPSYDMGSLPVRDAPISQPIPISTLASALANANPEQQRMVRIVVSNYYFPVQALVGMDNNVMLVNQWKKWLNWEYSTAPL